MILTLPPGAHGSLSKIFNNFNLIFSLTNLTKQTDLILINPESPPAGSTQFDLY